MRTAFRLLLPALLLTLGCGTSGGGGRWACQWTCNSSGTHGSHTYPGGPDPTTQCATDYGSDCSSFSCSCSQG